MQLVLDTIGFTLCVVLLIAFWIVTPV